MRITVLLLGLLAAPALAVDQGWTVMKSYDFSSIRSVWDEWTVEQWQPGFVNGELEVISSDFDVSSKALTVADVL